MKIQICCSYEYETSSDSAIAGSIPRKTLMTEDGNESVEDSTEHASFPDPDPATRPTPSTAASHVTACLGYADDNSGTRSFMDIIGGGQHPFSDSKSDSTSDAASRYKVLVRQLPPKDCVDRLVRFFFAEISWQYDVVDETTFRQQVLAWGRVTYAAHSQPRELDPEVRYFPALLFQVLAQAVLFQPRGDGSFLEDLRPSPDTDLIDLATEFSDAGHQILLVLGPTEPALVRVQAGLQRAIFLKTTASVVEAWHVLGHTIRDAQELGLHRLYSSSVQDVQSEQEQASFVVSGRRTWLVLHLWDAHMGVVLGRPMVTKLDPCNIPSPRRTCKSGTDSAGIAQQVIPFDMILCGYHAAYKYLQDIHKLDPWEPEAFAMVDLISATILAGIDQVPEWARSSNPVHDDQCPWLPVARETLVTEINFTLLALHRPFIFLRAGNRIEALKAALQVLQSQSRLFRMSDPRRFPTFNLVFATFDATVIVAAIYSLFPRDCPEYLQESLQCVQWALERLHAMKAQNSLAASAYTAIHGIYQKFLASISVPYISPISPPTTTTQRSYDTEGQTFSDQMGFANPQLELASDIPHDLANTPPNLPRAEINLEGTTDMPSIHHKPVVEITGVAHGAAHDSLIPDYENIMPPLPLHDLISGNSTTNMPSIYDQNFTVGDTEEAHAARYDFWQVLDACGK